jgi:hypothetical protein
VDQSAASLADIVGPVSHHLPEQGISMLTGYAVERSELGQELYVVPGVD